MIRQVPGKTNEIIWAEITFGRSVAFRHRGWARQGLPDSRTGRGGAMRHLMAKVMRGTNAATRDVPEVCPKLVSM